MSTLNIKVILGSTRQNRFGEKPALWIVEEAKKNPEFNVELLDLRHYPMPFYDNPSTPSMIKDGNYGHDVINAWSKKIAEADGFIIVAPEYNHGTSAVLKNALDVVYHEWKNKPVGFVSYGSAGGARAVEQLRLNAIELHMVSTRDAVHIPGSVVWGGEWNPTADKHLMGSAEKMLDQFAWWAKTLKTGRSA